MAKMNYKRMKADSWNWIEKGDLYEGDFAFFVRLLRGYLEITYCKIMH